MGKGNILYRVFAGSKANGYGCVYETTKRNKADEMVAKLMRMTTDYDKIYIVNSPVANFNKRDYDWED